MIDNIISYLPYAAWCFGGALVGMGTMAVLTMGKVADLRSDELLVDYFDVEYERAAHDRCADALETARNRIEYALEQETPNAAHGVKKMCRILRGEL